LGRYQDLKRSKVIMSDNRKGPHVVDRHVGAVIRDRRRALGLNQAALADRIGLTFQQVQKYECGDNRISASTLYEIAKALHVPVAAFFDGLPPTTECSGAPTNSGVGLVHRLTATGDGAAIAELFPEIRSPKLRKVVIDFVRAILTAEPEIAA
jgi:transcriptional regulator with XRE-family HTH domain